jgi:hypothetical protein
MKAATIKATEVTFIGWRVGAAAKAAALVMRRAVVVP